MSRGTGRRSHVVVYTRWTPAWGRSFSVESPARGSATRPDEQGTCHGPREEALASRSFRCVAHRHTDDVAVLVADHRAIEATPAHDVDPFRHVLVPARECRPRRRVVRLRHSGPTIARPMRTVN